MGSPRHRRRGSLYSSAADASHTLDYADGADGVVPSLAAGNLLVKYTLVGDANLDDSVNFADLVALAQSYGKSLSSSAVAVTSAAVTPGVQPADGASDPAIKSRHRHARRAKTREGGVWSSF